MRVIGKDRDANAALRRTSVLRKGGGSVRANNIEKEVFLTRRLRNYCINDKSSSMQFRRMEQSH